MKKWTIVVIAFLFLLIGCKPDLPTSDAASSPTSSEIDRTIREQTANSDLHRIALAVNDIPKGFKEEPGQTGEVDNKKAAQDRPDPDSHLKLLNELGRKGGYHTFYAKDPAELQKGGIYIVQSFVSAYGTVDGASKYFDYASLNSPSNLEKLSVPVIGEQSSAWRMRAGGSGPAVTGFVLNFQKSNIVATAIVIGFGEDSFLNEVVSYARIMEQRIAVGMD